MSPLEALQQAVVLTVKAMHPLNAQFLPEYRREIIKLIKIGTKPEEAR